MLTKLNKKQLFFGILAFLLVVNLLVIFNLNCFYLRAIFSFIFLTTIPGLLIMLMLKIRKINPWEYLVYVIGLSIAFLIFAGLFVNWTLPLFGIDKPLSLIPLLISFNVFLLTFWLIAYKRNKRISLKIKPPKLNRLNKVFFTIPTIFPILSILGAIVLNNHGPNYLTMIMLGGIAVYVFFVVLFRKKLNGNIYPFAILLISVSLLLMLSLRSWYISGYDISMEYQVFRLTKESSYWGMSNFRHAYNSCLSITILPTILSHFLKIDDQFIFKLIYPLIFSFASVGTYIFIKKQALRILAFLAGFFFLSQPWFIDPMVTLARQEIALFFFVLILLVLFNKTINPISKRALFLIFGFSMIVSHYSTTYVALALFVSTYFIVLIFRKTEDKKPFSKIYEKLNLKEKGKSSNREYYLSGTLVLLLIIFTFLWYAQLTESSYNIVDFTNKTIKNMGKIFSEEMRSEITKQVLYGSSTIPPTVFKDYFINKTGEYQKKQWITKYNKESYKDYKITPKFSKSLGRTNPKIRSASISLYKITLTLVRIFFLIGVIGLMFIQSKKFKRLDIEYTILALVCIISVGLMLLLPYVSLGYNFDRLYLQAIVIVSLVNVFGGLVVFDSISKRYFGIMMVTIIFILVFLYSFGFIWQISGYMPDVWLNNFGQQYDVTYTHKTEVESAVWLSDNYNDELVYANEPGRNKLWAFAGINNILTDTLPSTIDKDAYVYLTYANTIENRAFFFYKGNVLGYNYPMKFLSKNKDLIYNNGGSEIFR